MRLPLPLQKLRFKKVASTLIAASLLACVGMQLAGALSFHSGDMVTTGKNQKIDHTVYASGKNIEINSEVLGDIYCVGNDITISGTVHGDVLCAGKNVQITGNVLGDVRLAGQSVMVSGSISGNASLAGQNILLAQGAKVDGDVSSAGSRVTISGTVGRDLAAAGSSLVIDSVVGRDVNARVDALELTSKSTIKGDLEYTSQSEASKALGASIGGKTLRHEVDTSVSPKALLFLRFSFFLYLFAALLLAALLLALVFPRILHRSSDAVFAHPLKAFLVGVANMIVAPIICFLLFISVFGIPAGLMVLTAWFLTILLSGPATGYLIGRIILPRSTSIIQRTVLGGGALVVAYFIPYIGPLAMLSVLFFGSGSLLLALFKHMPRPDYRVPSAAVINSTSSDNILSNISANTPEKRVEHPKKSSKKSGKQ